MYLIGEEFWVYDSGMIRSGDIDHEQCRYNSKHSFVTHFVILSQTHKVVSTLNFKRSLGGTRADGLCDPFACFFTGRGGNAPRPSPTTMFSRLVPMATEDRAVVLW